MKITDVRTIPMSDPVPRERQHRTDLGTKVKSDAVLILVETDDGLTGMGASLGSPETVSAIVKYDLAPTLLGRDPMYSELLWEKMYNGSRWKPALERGHSQPSEARRGVTLEAIAGLDIAIWDVKSQAFGVPVYQALGPVRDSIRGYGSGVLFAASIHMAMSAPNCHILEVSQGYMLTMNESFNEPYDIRDGTVHAPRTPGLGLTLRDDVFDRFEYVQGPEFVF